jgi:hypothetical protein
MSQLGVSSAMAITTCHDLSSIDLEWAVAVLTATMLDVCNVIVVAQARPSKLVHFGLITLLAAKAKPGGGKPGGNAALGEVSGTSFIN